MRTLIILLLLSKSSLGQEIYSFSIDEPYPDRVSTDSIDNFIEKADSLWNKYQKKEFKRVDLDYNNNRTLQLIFDSLGQGIRLIEFYEDTVGIELFYSQMDSSYQLKKYEWFYGETESILYWYPTENKRVYWYYKEDDVLYKTISIQIHGNKKIVEETAIDFFEEVTTKKVFFKENNKWTLKEEEK
jgi:hypothetical protein